MELEGKSEETRHRFRQVWAHSSIMPYILFGGIVYCALRLGVEFLVGCSTDLGIPALFYISQRRVTSRLQGRSPSRFAG
jgi:hypothetical protein